MIEPAARCLMMLAYRCLADERRDWGLAMAAEFDAAAEDGRPLGFAIGCLLAAWRDLAAREDGRLVIATYALALGVVLPAAALLLTGAVYGYPTLDLATGVPGARPWINHGNVAAAPSLTLMVLGLAVGQVALAWALTERDWARVGMLARIGAATGATLVLFTGVVVPGETRLGLPVAGMLVEAALVAALARRCARLRHQPFLLDPNR